jgi:hypothetical protein
VDVSGDRSASVSFSSVSSSADYGKALFNDLTIESPLSGPYVLFFVVSCPGGAASAAASANCAAIQAATSQGGAGLATKATLKVEPGRAVSLRSPPDAARALLPASWSRRPFSCRENREKGSSWLLCFQPH